MGNSVITRLLRKYKNHCRATMFESENGIKYELQKAIQKNEPPIAKI